MALSSTTHAVQLELADVDRGVYDSLALTVARHPSETAEHLVARVLAYALELDEGLAFSRGLCAGEEPALWQHDLTGALHAWIEVGTPSAERLHKASKAAGRVAVYCHKDPTPWLAGLAGARVHGAERIALHALDRGLVAALAEGLERRLRLSLTRTEGTLFVDAGDRSLSAPLTPLAWPQG
ncbi:MAG: YaeQ family protein [Alphaproteobacteria bacterium]|nr:YaeQ family protein [Alphaproteobacteria bacterium]